MDLLKRKVTFLILFPLSLCFLGCIEDSATPSPTPQQPAPTVSTGALHVEGNLIKDASGKQVILKGVNIPDPQHLNTKPQERPGVSALSVAKQVVEELKVSVVRIPVLPGSSASSPDGWFSTANGREKYFQNHLDPLVKYLTSNKIYAIVDLHYISDYSGKLPAVKEFWTYVAPKYKDNPYVIYEMFNEPIYPDDWSTWKNTLAQPTVDLIRQFAPENLIIVGGPSWSSHMWGAATNPIVGKNIVYTAHVYPNQTPTKWERNFGALQKVAPVFVTEWGWEQYNNPATSTGTTSGFGVPFHKWMKDRNLSWCAWTFDFVWEPRMVDNKWKLKGGDSYMGQYVFDQLKQ